MATDSGVFQCIWIFRAGLIATANNALLIMAQRPDAQKPDYGYWREQVSM